MKYKQFDNKFIVRIDHGEEIMENLKRVCQENKIALGTISALGAVESATLRFFNTEKKSYSDKEFAENMEITNLTGNISTMNSEVYLHCHITLGDSNYHAIAGHLLSARVGGTFEAVVEKVDGQVDRKHDESIGLNLWDF